MAGSFLVAFVVVVRASYSVLIGWWGTNHNDLSDIGPAIFALVVAVVVSLLAALIAMLIASAPALALIGKSGVFNRVLRRRQAAETFVEEWPL